jgi:hypothetical protein
MSDAKHTPGPWTIDTACTPTNGIRGSNGEIVCMISWLGLSEECRERMGANAALLRSAPDLLAERDHLQKFKDYVHGRLDAAGVPTHPDGPHSKEGCRVGDRLDILIGQRDEMLAACQAALPRMLHALTIRTKLVGISEGGIADVVKQLQAAISSNHAPEKS